MSEITVITDAVRDEARKWRRLSDSLEPVKNAAAGLDLAITAFFIGDANAGVHSQAYNGFQSFVVTALTGGVTEFEQLGAALDKIADAYDEADRIVSLDLNKIYSV